MTDQHPITPPPEVVDRLFMIEGSEEDRIIAAYRAGADHELDACVEWLQHNYPDGTQVAALWAARRPKPPSLRKQAYDALDTYIYGEPDPKDKERTYNTIRRALEALDD
jgi:hypothetical protein